MKISIKLISQRPSHHVSSLASADTDDLLSSHIPLFLAHHVDLVAGALQAGDLRHQHHQGQGQPDEPDTRHHPRTSGVSQ